MSVLSQSGRTVVRTSRGLTVAGTRVTLYDVMDYLAAGWPTDLIGDRLNLASAQMADVLAYIDAHGPEVQAEYQTVLQQAEENRRYWEARTRKRLEPTEESAPPAGQEALRAKLREWKARLQTSD